MDQFYSVLPNDMNTEKVSLVALENKLHPPDGVPNDLAARNLAILSLSNSVRHTPFSELVFSV